MIMFGLNLEAQAVYKRPRIKHPLHAAGCQEMKIWKSDHEEIYMSP